ncbi:MAG: aldo/keto reductase, partial [Pigmentiphaga sp.]
SHLEQVSLLAYSPLAMGVLTGKYRHGARPAGARLTVYERFDRYTSPQAMGIAEAYCALAEAQGMTPATMALAWVNSRPFVASNLIGATTLAQLKENLDSVNVELSQDVLEEIDRLHELQPNPGR